MLKKTLSGIIAFTLLSIIALGIVSASPNAQAETGPDSFTFFVFVLSDANARGLTSDDIDVLLSDYVIENLIVPYTFETPEEVKERLSAQGQTSFRFLITVLSDANDKGVMPDNLSELLSGWFVENLIAPHTGETPEQVTERLSSHSTPTPTATPTATATPATVSELVRNVENGIVVITTDTGLGTGFIIDADGRIVTNAHVVERLSTVTVELADETVYEANVLGVDELADVAVIQIPDKRLFHPIPLGDSSLAQVGDEVVVIGYPVGLKTVTTGIVSAKLPIGGVEHIQTDAAINPGNSGGPLLNSAGQVIGVNAFKAEETNSGRPIDNIGFAIAINEVKSRLDSLTAGQSVYDNSPRPVPDPDDGWTRYKNGEYGYSIDVPPAWSFNTEFDDERYAHFESSDGRALAEIRAYDVPDSFSLRQFAEQRRDALDVLGFSGSVDLLEIDSFERVDDTGDEFYLLTYRYQPSSTDCVSDVTERIRLSSSYPGKLYGFGITFSICEDSLAAHIFDRDAMFDTFLEWHRYASPTYGYSVNIAPDWVLNTVLQSGAVASILPLRRGGAVTVEVYAPPGDFTLEDFANWQDGQLYAEAESWQVFEPHFLTKKREQIGGQEAYISAYTARKSSEHCDAGYIDLIALSSYRPENPYGFIVFTGVCLFLMDELNEDRLEMLDSFRY